MTLFDRGTLTCPKLVDYVLSACKPREAWCVGMEVEKMGLRASDGMPIPYEGVGASVRAVLETYRVRRGGDPVLEGDHPIGLDGPWGTVSLEPGGQVEWSSRPVRTLGALRRDLDAHLAVMAEIGSELGVRWLETGVQPDVGLDRMPWMPKARYAIMSRYLASRGRLAHRMMTQTASIQCSFDFESAEDWSRKFRAGALLAPVGVALFANSSRADSRNSGWASFRQAIWAETDRDRCGLPPVVFEPGFGVEDWVEWACDVPVMFVQRARGLVPMNGAKFRSLLDQVGCEAVSLEDWELHLSCIFTDVRSYSYIEVRSADLQPDPLIAAVPAFWTGILYDEDSLSAALDLGAGHANHAGWSDAMASAARDGLAGRAGSRSLAELASEAVKLAVRGLRGGAACADDATDAAAPLLALARARGIERSRTTG